MLLCQDSCLHQDDDPGGRAVVLAGGEDEADDVHHRGEDWAKLTKFCLFQGLGASFTKYTIQSQPGYGASEDAGELICLVLLSLQQQHVETLT